jgi:hypothetical protein
MVDLGPSEPQWVFAWDMDSVQTHFLSALAKSDVLAQLRAFSIGPCRFNGRTLNRIEHSSDGKLSAWRLEPRLGAQRPVVKLPKIGDALPTKRSPSSARPELMFLRNVRISHPRVPIWCITRRLRPSSLKLVPERFS